MEARWRVTADCKKVGKGSRYSGGAREELIYWRDPQHVQK